MPSPVRMGKLSMFADLVAPPVAPVAGTALLKEKTVRARRASPVRSVVPWERRRWKRFMAVGAVRRSRNRAAWSAVDAEGRAEDVAVDGTGGRTEFVVDDGAGGRAVVTNDDDDGNGVFCGKACTEDNPARARSTTLEILSNMMSSCKVERERDVKR